MTGLALVDGERVEPAALAIAEVLDTDELGADAEDLEIGGVAVDLEGGVDASRCALREGDALVTPQRCDEVGGSIEPDVAIDGVLGAHEAIDEGDERRAGVGAAMRGRVDHGGCVR